MELKQYQTDTLNALSRFLDRARAGDPAAAFAALAPGATYTPMNGAPGTPHVCLRLPTGGGKTLLAAETVRLAAEKYLETERPLVLWMVPSDAIKSQTVEALRNPRHAYRRRLDAAFGGRVRVFDIADFEMIRPHDLAQNACVVVSTIQSFRVKNTVGRKVYAYHEEMEPHFSSIHDHEGMERVSPEEAAESGGRLKAGAVKFSFANLLFHHRPLVIVDEAHNATTPTSHLVLNRVGAALVVEFTATPQGMNNVLHSVTAGALKLAEMIKLPIRLRAHGAWQEAVGAAVATRNMLDEKGLRDPKRIRPVALYQAQPKNGEPTVEELKAYLIEEKGILERQIAVATGSQRELDGVDLSDPACVVRHVITVDALKEGWDCPSAYVLCATQRLQSATAVEQILGRVLRMPFAERRRDAALNCAYAEVSEPSFQAAAETLRDKLISMGFTDEEVKESLKPAELEKDPQGRLFDPDPVRPAEVFQTDLDDTEETRTALNGFGEAGVELRRGEGGRLTVAVKGPIAPPVRKEILARAPEGARPALAAEMDRHEERVERRRSPAERGVVIEAPALAIDVQGELFQADTDLMMELHPWSICDAPAEVELHFDPETHLIEIDLDGERIVYRELVRHQERLPGVDHEDDAAMAPSLVQWLERKCRAEDIPGEELRRWLAALVTWLTGPRGMSVRDLFDLQYPLAKAIQSLIARARKEARGKAYQAALFAPDVAVTGDSEQGFLFRDGVFAGCDLHPLGPRRFAKHLLGDDRVPRMDGKPDGEEFQCAVAIDMLDEVEVWSRNVSRHRDAFWLPTAEDRFYPDFVAKLTDGRLFVIEYKGELTAGTDDTREKRLIGDLWARATGNLFLIVERRKHGLSPREQMKAHINAA